MGHPDVPGVMSGHALQNLLSHFAPDLGLEVGAVLLCSRDNSGLARISSVPLPANTVQDQGCEIFEIEIILSGTKSA